MRQHLEDKIELLRFGLRISSPSGRFFQIDVDAQPWADHEQPCDMSGASSGSLVVWAVFRRTASVVVPSAACPATCLPSMEEELTENSVNWPHKPCTKGYGQQSQKSSGKRCGCTHLTPRAIANHKNPIRRSEGAVEKQGGEGKTKSTNPQTSCEPSRCVKSHVVHDSCLTDTIASQDRTAQVCLSTLLDRPTCRQEEPKKMVTKLNRRSL